jgi:hypothetical protein
MNTAHPASLPPGPRSSAGIRRSTTASMSEPSSAKKNIHGPGCTGEGGLAVPGLHGIAWPIVKAPAETELVKRETAVEARSERRDILARKMAFVIVVLRTRSARTSH